MKTRISAFLLALAMVFGMSEVYAQSPGQANGKTNAQTLQLNFATSAAAKDTLTAVETSKNTQQFDLRGVSAATLVNLIVNTNGDQTDTVEVNVAISMDGTTWSDRVPIDSILVTAADGDSSYYSLDLLGSEVDATLLAVAGKTFLPLETYPRVRLSFDSINLAGSMHVFPWLVKTYDTR